MNIRTQCRCGQVLDFPPTAAGQSYRCAQCGSTWVIPHPVAPVTRTPSGFGAKQAVIGFLIAATICVSIVVAGIFWVRSKFRQATNHISGWVGLIDGIDQLGNVDQIIADYEEKGYERVAGQMVVEHSPISRKRLYTCQALDVKSDINTDVAIMAQMATIRGIVDGDLDFMGQVLVIEKGAVVKGDVNSRLAQMITVRGTIEGELTGGYQALESSRGRIVKGTKGTQKLLSDIGSAVKDVQQRRRQFEQAERAAKDKLSEQVAALTPPVRGLVEKLSPKMSRYDKRGALEQLAKVTPNDADRETVLKNVAVCLTDHVTGDAAANAFRVWGTKSQAPILLDLISTGQQPSPRVIVELLIDLDAREAVVTLINHQDSTTSTLAAAKLEEWDITAEVIADQCVLDLERIGQSRGSRVRERVLRRLESLNLVEQETKSRVSQTVIPLITTASSSELNDMLDVLAKTVTEDDFALLVEHAPGRIVGSQYARFLGEFNDARIHKFLVHRAIQQDDSDAASVLERKTKEAAEEFVWPHLEGKSSSVRRRAAELLGDIGSLRSVPLLESFESDPAMRRDVERAIQRIRTRVGS